MYLESIFRVEMLGFVPPLTYPQILFRVEQPQVSPMLFRISSASLLKSAVVASLLPNFFPTSCLRNDILSESILFVNYSCVVVFEEIVNLYSLFKIDGVKVFVMLAVNLMPITTIA